MGIQVTCNDHPEREYAQVGGNGENPTYMRVVIWSDLHRNMQQLVSPTSKEVTNLTEHYVEDYISALLSKDTNKLKVYLGHEIYEVKVGSDLYVMRDDSKLVIQGEEVTVAKAATTYCSNPEQVFDFDKQFNDLELDTVIVDSKLSMTKIGNSQGYDGHALRAYSYFQDTLSSYPNTVNGINQIKKDDRDERQESKSPTFQLTLT